MASGAHWHLKTKSLNWNRRGPRGDHIIIKQDKIQQKIYTMGKDYFLRWEILWGNCSILFGGRCTLTKNHLPPIHLKAVRHFLRRLRANAPSDSLRKGATLLVCACISPAHLKDQQWQQKYFEALDIPARFRKSRDINALKILLLDEFAELHGLKGNVQGDIDPNEDLLSEDCLKSKLKELQKQQGSFYTPREGLWGDELVQGRYETLYVLLLSMAIPLAPFRGTSLMKSYHRALEQIHLVLKEIYIRSMIVMNHLL